MSLETRQLEPELMDDPTLASDQHRQALNGLARVHAFTRTAVQIWNEVSSLEVASPERPLVIMDVGCGDAFLLREIYRLAERAGHPLTLIGCDFSATAIEFARSSAQQSAIPIEFHQIDVTKDELPRADVIINSLFLHHFTETEVISIFEKFDASADRAVVIQDLARTRLGYGLCWIGTRLLSRSRIVHVDGLLSVKAAFSSDEIRQMLDAAGIPQAKLMRQWPERILISWKVQRDEFL